MIREVLLAAMKGVKVVWWLWGCLALAALLWRFGWYIGDGVVP